MAKVLHVVATDVAFGNVITEAQIHCSVKVKNDAGLEQLLEVAPLVTLRDALGAVKTPQVLNQELMTDVKAYLANAFGISPPYAAEFLLGGFVLSA